MMTKSKMLLAEAIANLDATLQERADIREHLRDNDVNGIYDESCARHVAEMMLEKIRDANAEDKAEPKWERYHWGVRLCNGYDSGYQFPHCMVQAAWELITDINGTLFRVYACDKHAGKEKQDETDL